MLRQPIKTLTLVFLFCMLCMAFTSGNGKVALYESTLHGVWRVDAAEIKKGFAYHPVRSFDPETKPVLRFDASRRTLTIADSGQVMPIGWIVRKVETMVDTEPFVYRTDVVLNLNADLPLLYIDAADDVYLEFKKSRLILRYRKNRCEYRLRLSPA